jgi:lipopolysaccharide/colanic/teichoic acid biosynthesis glycosyltransferase
MKSEIYKFIETEIDTLPKNIYTVSKFKEFNKVEFQNFNICFIEQKLNYVSQLNENLLQLNKNINYDQYIIGCAETFVARRNRNKIISKIIVINKIVKLFDFTLNRVIPKIWGFKQFYFLFTKNQNRILSKAEILGRLIYCDFEIVKISSINNILYFIIKKTNKPIKFSTKPSYGPFFKMERVGKNGRIIGVYKFRTMHPYAEYLQNLIINQNGYSQTGKPANDFRITPWGRFFRKYWLDELPQIINLLKGEMKLIGVRPVSKRYFEDIPTEIQKLRIKQKPGCIPPYVFLNKKNDKESVLEAEKIYLLEKEKNPYTTDIKSFFKALWNIIFKQKRSA